VSIPRKNMKTIWDSDGVDEPVLICCPPEFPCTCDANLDSIETCKRHGMFRLHDGRWVTAKPYEGELSAKTYANLTQAETARQKMTQPHDWRVTGRRPYFVTLIGESNE